MIEKINIEEYNLLNTEINEFEESIISGERKVVNLDDWLNIKNRIFMLKKMCVDVYRGGLGNPIPSDIEDKALYKSMMYLYDSIEQIEQNYMGRKLVEDIDTVMDNIRILVQNNRINRVLNQMQEISKLSYEKGISIVNVKDYYENDYVIASTLTAKFVQNTILQEQLHEDYKNANEFVFGKSLKR